MSNRGRHKKKNYITRVIPGWSLLQYKFTSKGKTYLHNIHCDELYKIYLNEEYKICQIEEGTKNRPYI